MLRKLALAYVAIIVLVIGFQIAVVAGAPLGAFTQSGHMTGVLDFGGRVTAVISILIISFCAFAVYRTATTEHPSLGLRIGFRVVLALNALEFIVNWITPSDLERMIWGPVNTVLFTLVVAIAVIKRRA